MGKANLPDFFYKDDPFSKQLMNIFNNIKKQTISNKNELPENFQEIQARITEILKNWKFNGNRYDDKDVAVNLWGVLKKIYSLLEEENIRTHFDLISPYGGEKGKISLEWLLENTPIGYYSKEEDLKRIIKKFVNPNRTISLNPRILRKYGRVLKPHEMVDLLIEGKKEQISTQIGKLTGGIHLRRKKKLGPHHPK